MIITTDKNIEGILHRKCKQCNIYQPLVVNFFKSGPSHLRGRLAVCKKCISIQRKKARRDLKTGSSIRAYERQIRSKRFSENPKKHEKYKNYLKKWFKEHPERKRQYTLSKYGLAYKEYLNLLEQQNYCCSCCQKSFETMSYKHKPHVDHCHTSGKIRSILCHGCNTGLGAFQDDIQLLHNAIKYLQIHQPSLIPLQKTV